ncbi:hypothetical protein CVT24_001132 [Panaeolus cyanescens]|uniref:Uncharacterized protein n=1 Tax=Panaeolus cyanescens TaxID=181874 RepID=A0A409W6U5_9AGAR|nr:hypothetical protein CVT24_001132 [Panaeolus cyanescens]
MNEHYDTIKAGEELDSIASNRISKDKDIMADEYVQNAKMMDYLIVQQKHPIVWKLAYANNPEEEVLLRLPGILCQKELPPVTIPLDTLTRKHTKKYLRQQVQITGLGGIQFDHAINKIREIYLKFADKLDEKLLHPWRPDSFNSFPAINAATRYFTPTRMAASSTSVAFASYVDPDGRLKQAMGSEFIHTMENRVEYYEMIHGLNDGVSYRAVDPVTFKVGDIVEAILAFSVVPVTPQDIRNGSKKMIISLRSLALLDNTQRMNAALVEMQTQASISFIQPLAPSANKRRRVRFNQDATDEEDSIMGLKRLHLADSERSSPRKQEVPVDVQGEGNPRKPVAVSELFGVSLLTIAETKQWNEAEAISQMHFLDQVDKAPLSTLLALNDAGYIDREKIAETLHTRLHELTAKPFCLKADVIFLFLHRFGAKLSGSVLIRLIHPDDKFEPDDLDFYIEAAVENEAIDFLIKHGYIWSKPQFDINRSTSSQSQTNYSYPHSSSYTRLYRLCLPQSHGGKSINLIVSKGKSILPILCFHSTQVMNYLSHHGLVILYPDTTLNHIGISNTPGNISDMAPLAQAGIRKYEQRGWTFKYSRQLAPHKCSLHPYCAQFLRSIHDHAVLHVPTLYYALQDETIVQEARMKDAMLGNWRLAGGKNCLKTSSASNHGYAYVDGEKVDATGGKTK